MGSGAGKALLPLVSLAVAPLTGGASLGGLAGGPLGTAVGLANTGFGVLDAARQTENEAASTAAALQTAKTEKLIADLDIGEEVVEAERRRARQLAALANTGSIGRRGAATLAGAVDRDTKSVFRSLASRKAALDGRSRRRIAEIRRQQRRAGSEHAMGVLGTINALGRGAISAFGDEASFRD